MRNTHDPLLDAFDAPDGSLTTPLRNVTTTPTQALLMINGPWTLGRARALADRLRGAASDDPQRIELAYRLAYGRPPEPRERTEAAEFLRTQARPADESARSPAVPRTIRPGPRPPWSTSATRC
jgi:hypothetical protein